MPEEDRTQIAFARKQAIRQVVRLLYRFLVRVISAAGDEEPDRGILQPHRERCEDRCREIRRIQFTDTQNVGEKAVHIVSGSDADGGVDCHRCSISSMRWRPVGADVGEPPGSGSRRHPGAWPRTLRWAGRTSETIAD